MKKDNICTDLKKYCGMLKYSFSMLLLLENTYEFAMLNRV